MGHFYALVYLLLLCSIFQTSTAGLYCQEGGRERAPQHNRKQVNDTEVGKRPSKTTVLCCGMYKISSDTHTCCMGSRAGLETPCCLSVKCECTPPGNWIRQTRDETLKRNATIKALSDQLSMERRRLEVKRDFYTELIHVLEELQNHNDAGGGDLKDILELVKCLEGKGVSPKNRKELEDLTGLLQSNRGTISSVQNKLERNSKDCWDDAHATTVGFSWGTLEKPSPVSEVQASIEKGIKTYKETILDVTHYNYHQVDCMLGPLKNDLKLSWYLIDLLDSELTKSGRVEKRSVENEMDAEGEGGSFDSISNIRNAARSRVARQASEDCPVTKWSEHIGTITDKITQAEKLLEDVSAAITSKQNPCRDRWIVNPLDAR